MLTIREATAGDAATMARLNAWVHDLHVAEEPDVYRPLDRAWLADTLALALTEGREKAWLAFWNDDAVGMVRCEHRHKAESAYTHAQAFVEVHELVVDPEARRKGVAAALMEPVEELAMALGVEVRLTCRAFNGGAQRFYEALGYRPMWVRYRKGLGDPS